MENPALLLGVPLVVVGAVGVLAALATLLGSLQLPAWLLEPVGGEEQAAHIAAARQARVSRAQAVVAEAGRAHPGPIEYLRIGVALALVTIVEVAIYYAEALEGALLAILLVLSAMKFALVVLWFMHLRFDSRTFSQMFVGGLVLAAALFVVVLATLGSSLV